MEANFQFQNTEIVENNDYHQLYEVEEHSVSDVGSCTNHKNNDRTLFDDDLIRLDKKDVGFYVIGQIFLTKLGLNKDNVNIIEAIHKMNWSNSHTLSARLGCFQLFHDVSSCIKFAWYCDSKEGIQSIVSYGFGHRELGGRHGVGLTPYNSLAQNVRNCLTDRDGLKHVLLCQVLLSESEESLTQLIHHDNNVVSPVEYVDSTKINTHILPQFVVSFRTTSCFEGSPKARETTKKPAAPSRLPISNLISILSKLLPQHAMKLINKHHKEFKERKISRQDLIKKLQQYAGRDILMEIIKLCGDKRQL